MIPSCETLTALVASMEKATVMTLDLCPLRSITLRERLYAPSLLNLSSHTFASAVNVAMDANWALYATARSWFMNEFGAKLDKNRPCAACAKEWSRTGFVQCCRRSLLLLFHCKRWPKSFQPQDSSLSQAWVVDLCQTLCQSTQQSVLALSFISNRCYCLNACPLCPSHFRRLVGVVH